MSFDEVMELVLAAVLGPVFIYLAIKFGVGVGSRALSLFPRLAQSKENKAKLFLLLLCMLFLALFLSGISDTFVWGLCFAMIFLALMFMFLRTGRFFQGKFPYDDSSTAYQFTLNTVEAWGQGRLNWLAGNFLKEAKGSSADDFEYLLRPVQGGALNTLYQFVNTGSAEFLILYPASKWKQEAADFALTNKRLIIKNSSGTYDHLPLNEIAQYHLKEEGRNVAINVELRNGEQKRYDELAFVPTEFAVKQCIAGL